MSKQYIMQEFEPQESPKKSFLDRIFGDSVGNTTKAISKMLLVILFVGTNTILSGVIGAAVFGADSNGQTILVVLVSGISFFLARLAWVVKY